MHCAWCDTELIWSKGSWMSTEEVKPNKRRKLYVCSVRGSNLPHDVHLVVERPLAEMSA